MTRHSSGVLLPRYLHTGDVLSIPLSNNTPATTKQLRLLRSLGIDKKNTTDGDLRIGDAELESDGSGVVQLRISDSHPGKTLTLMVRGNDGVVKELHEHTLRAGSRRVPIVKELKGGAFQQRQPPSFLEFEDPEHQPIRGDGQIVIEEAITWNFGEIAQSLTRFLKSHRFTANLIAPLTKPSSYGNCSTQLAQYQAALGEYYRTVDHRNRRRRVLNTLSEYCEASIDENKGKQRKIRKSIAAGLLEAIHEAGGSMFQYMRMDEFVRLEAYLYISYITQKKKSKAVYQDFDDCFRELEYLGYKSRIVRRSLMPPGSFDLDYEASLLFDELNMGALQPFMDYRTGRSSSPPSDAEWLALIHALQDQVLTMNIVAGEDLGVGNSLLNSGMGDILSNTKLWMFAIALLLKDADGSYLQPENLSTLEVTIRPSRAFHIRTRVVCDRIFHGESQQQAQLDILYSSRQPQSNDISKNRELIHHEGGPLILGDAIALVLRIKDSTRYSSSSSFSQLDRNWLDGIRDAQVEGRMDDQDHHRMANPIEAFVTLPWFARIDMQQDLLNSSGFISADADQLVHVHFINYNPYQPDELFCIIPLQLPYSNASLVGTRGIRRGREDLISSLTICFRSMYAQELPHDGEEKLLNTPHDPVRWWVERDVLA